MMMPRFKLLALVAAAVLVGSTGIGNAGSNTASGDTLPHRYCPPGSSLYWGIFGYWCEDSAYDGVHPIECKSGPGQVVSTWNNAPVTEEAICTHQGTPSGETWSIN